MLQIKYGGNYHTVVQGKLYRSAQPTPDQIVAHQAQDGIASILNLRGAAPGQKWYDDEVATAAARGIVHADYAMASSVELTKAQMIDLVALMRDLPKPILVHCEHGADRSGLAAALYLGGILGDDEDVAEAQLSIRFGHFSVPYLSHAYAMDESFEQYEPLLPQANG